MRKIIQISTSGVENTMSTQCNYVVHALCDDGTLWIRTNNHGWELQPDVPQHDHIGEDNKMVQHVCNYLPSLFDDGATLVCSCGKWK